MPSETMDILYQINTPIGTDQFIALLEASSLAARRPVEDRECIEGMLRGADLLVSAWDQGALVGVARSVTDFHYACYLSDLAVAQSHQRRGIGRHLQRLTQDQLGGRCTLILLAAPGANDYYPRIGFRHNPRCWTLDGEAELID